MFVTLHKRPRLDFATLERDVDRILQSWSDQSVPVDYGFTVTPDENGVTVRADVPGVEPSAIHVAVNGRALTISGERNSEKHDDDAREYRYGKFSRTFQLSEDLDTGSIDAECRNGVLTLRIAKRPEAKPRQIEVKSS